MICNLCPRKCNADRSRGFGICGTDGAMVSRIAKHYWEEPCVSGDVGSGTVFFAGCNLRCRFCQNFDISSTPHGILFSAERLADVFLYLESQGVANINLVTPTHVSDVIAKALTLAKPFLKIPVVYNTSSYEEISALQNLEGLVDVYLPDLKFFSRQISREMCGAPDYFDVATKAIAEMKRQQPRNIFQNGFIKKGIIIRHLVLPNCVEDTKSILDWIARFDNTAYVSLMSQYFPARTDEKYPQLNRRLFKHEYDNACDYFFNIGLKNGYMQELSSATVEYLPSFDDNDVESVLENVPHIFD